MVAVSDMSMQSVGQLSLLMSHLHRIGGILPFSRSTGCIVLVWAILVREDLARYPTCPVNTSREYA